MWQKINNSFYVSGIILLFIVIIFQIPHSKGELAKNDLPTLLKMFEKASKNDESQQYSVCFPQYLKLVRITLNNLLNMPKNLI